MDPDKFNEIVLDALLNRPGDYKTDEERKSREDLDKAIRLGYVVDLPDWRS